MITDQEVDEDEDISEEAKTEFLVEIQGKNWVPTTAAFHKIKFAYNDILKSRCETGAEYEWYERIFKKKAKNKQNQSRDRKDQVKSKSKVNHMKKIQLGGLKIAKPQVVLQESKDKGLNCKRGKVYKKVIKT
ncbi:hypothetical protein Tco_0620625 [Tanacetum coccineum]